MENDIQHNQEGRERRKYLRISRNYILDCTLFSIKNLQMEPDQQVMQGVMRNISAGGVLFESECKFAVGTLLKIDLALPGWQRFKTEFLKEDTFSISEPLTVLARVVRLEVIELDRLYDVGVCFSAVDEGHKIGLLKYINQEHSTS